MRNPQVFAVAVLALLLTAPRAAAAPPVAVGAPQTRVLVTHVELEGNRAIYPRLFVMEPDGALRRLVDGLTEAAAWSPTGDRVAFHTAQGLEVVGADGSGRRLVRASVQMSPQAWSPDGARIAVAEGDGALALVDVATGAATTFPDLGVVTGTLSWSPDGGAVTFVGPLDDQRILELETGEVRELAPGILAQFEPAYWSPSGQLLAFEGVEGVGTPDARAGVYLVGPDGAGLRYRTAGFDPRWSPDGSRLAINSADTPQVAVVAADGATAPVPVPLPPGGSRAYEPSWTGDGAALLMAVAFEDDNGTSLRTALYRIAVPSGAPTPLVEFDGRDVVIPRAAPGTPGPPLSAPVAAALWWSRDLPAGSAATVLLGRADLFADALSSGGLQGALEAPLLLTPGDALHPAVLTELQRLGAQRVVLLGGTAALSAGVADELASAGLQVERVDGLTRLETAVAVARRGFSAPTTIVLARAFGDAEDPTRAFADSLGAGALAAALPAPLLLSTGEALSPQVAAYLGATPSVTDAIVVGGTAALADAVVSELQARGLLVQRVGGATRFDTAAALTRLRAPVPGPVGTVVLVDGTAPDAWASGFTAARLAASLSGGGLLLTAGEQLPQATAARLAQARGAEEASSGPIEAMQCAPDVLHHTCVNLASRLLESGADPLYVAVLAGEAATELAVLRVRDQPTVCGATELAGGQDATLLLDASLTMPALGCTFNGTSFPFPLYGAAVEEGAGSSTLDLVVDGETIASGTLVEPDRSWDLQVVGGAATGLLFTDADRLCAGVDTYDDGQVSRVSVRERRRQRPRHDRLPAARDLGGRLHSLARRAGPRDGRDRERPWDPHGVAVGESVQSVNCGRSASRRAWCTNSAKRGALAKNSGASKRTTRRPGMRRPSGWRFTSW